MSIDIASIENFNLRSANILLLESGLMDMDILFQIVTGFGGKLITKCEDVASAKTALSKTQFDLVIADTVLRNEDGCAFVEWLRRETTPPNRFVPVIMVSPHTKRAKVTRARDCGAHFVVAKPLRPVVLLERILWVVQEQRGFVTTQSYSGPDRRFKFAGPPTGTTGRRADDLSASLGDAKEPNMSQGEIDALMQPTKVSI